MGVGHNLHTRLEQAQSMGQWLLVVLFPSSSPILIFFPLLPFNAQLELLGIVRVVAYKTPTSERTPVRRPGAQDCVIMP